MGICTRRDYAIKRRVQRPSHEHAGQSFRIRAVGVMNMPSAIKGFATSAPSFPNIDGLPLYPFGEALFNALTERFALFNRTISTGSDPYPATGRGFCPVQTHTHEHFLILDDFDDALSSISSWYVNQYTITQHSYETWSFSTLLAKAQELMNISNGEAFPKLSNSSYGRTLAPWAVQRAVMVSLLTHANIINRQYGQIRVTYKQGSSENQPSYASAYSEAIANATEYQTLLNELGNSPPVEDQWLGGKDGSLNPKYSGLISELTKLEYIPKNGYENLLNATFQLQLTTRVYSNFESFGSPFVLGDNLFPVTMQNGCFYTKEFYTDTPASFPNSCGWRVDRGGYLFGDYSDYFQYGMTWDES